MNYQLKQYPATMVLMAINIFLFAVTALQGATGQVLVNLGAMYPPYMIFLNQYWRLITAGLLHSSAMHLVMNMLSLYVVGTILEPLLGKERFVASYFMASILGATFSFSFGELYRLSVGASGAIFGFFMIIVLLTKLAPYHRGLRALSQQFMGTVLLNIAFSFLPGVDFLSHLGGAIGGVVAFYVLGYFQNNRNKQWQLMLGYVTMIVVLILMKNGGI